jgi:hypothetical protein
LLRVLKGIEVVVAETGGGDDDAKVRPPSSESPVLAGGGGCAAGVVAGLLKKVNMDGALSASGTGTEGTYASAPLFMKSKTEEVPLD